MNPGQLQNNGRTDDADSDVAVYVHFPYCLQKCPYCDFNSYPITDRKDLAPYTNAVLAELDERLPALARGRLRSIFLGGGTPSLWDAAAVHRVLAKIEDGFADRADHVEITLEANPGAVDRGRLAEFRAAGVNRVSLGVQALDDGLLKTLGRVHSAREAREALAIVQDTGFASHSIDLIYGIPGQSRDVWRNDVRTAISLATPHVSAYNLIYEPGTLMESWRARGAVTPLEESDEIAMFDAVRVALGASGMLHYEISNFAQPGHESIHNQIYWRARPYLGVGAGAHSFLPLGDSASSGTTLASNVIAERTAGVRAPAAYIAAWTGSRTLRPAPFELRETIDASQLADEHALLGLRTRRGWDAVRTERECAVPAVMAASRVALRHPEWCEWDGDHLRPTARGYLMNNSLILAAARAMSERSAQSNGGSVLQ